MAKKYVFRRTLEVSCNINFYVPYHVIHVYSEVRTKVDIKIEGKGGTLFIYTYPERLDVIIKMSSTTTPKKAKATKPKAPPAHPKYIDMVKAAIGSLKDKSGSSKAAILKYITANYKVGDNVKMVNTHLRTALKTGVTKGFLKQTKGTGASGSFKLGEKPKAEKKPKKVTKPKAAKPKKAAAKPKKAAAPKKEGGDKKKATKPKKAKTPKKAAKKSPKKAAKPKAAKPKTAKKAKTPKKAAKKE